MVTKSAVKEGKESHISSLLKKIDRKTYNIGIMGLGYVGLPLMWTFHKNEMPVIGFDVDDKKLIALSAAARTSSIWEKK